ncbi:hypothetical protein C0989_000877 [Termitomyces sp. Mn162]|nr:hypothetical protein C0989_000877 [Termitomyces sp. Mn162]
MKPFRPQGLSYHQKKCQQYRSPEIIATNQQIEHDLQTSLQVERQALEKRIYGAPMLGHDDTKLDDDMGQNIIDDEFAAPRLGAKAKSNVKEDLDTQLSPPAHEPSTSRKDDIRVTYHPSLDKPTVFEHVEIEVAYGGVAQTFEFWLRSLKEFARSILEDEYLGRLAVFDSVLLENLMGEIGSALFMNLGQQIGCGMCRANFQKMGDHS